MAVTSSLFKFAVLIVAAGALLSGAWMAMRPEVATATKAAESSASPAINAAEQWVELTERQAEAFEVRPVETRAFRVTRNAVGSIDFNQNMLVQAFTSNSGRIVDTFFNIGDEVRKGEALFTIDSPDLLQAESSLLAAAGVLELQTRTLARVQQLLKAGGGAQKDVDQATSDQQTAEGNYKAAHDAVRIFGKTDAEIERTIRIESTLR
jgi:cobalt-zinc-cadmium efflux system membrane fusion protein